MAAGIDWDNELKQIRNELDKENLELRREEVRGMRLANERAEQSLLSGPSGNAEGPEPEKTESLGNAIAQKHETPRSALRGVSIAVAFNSGFEPGREPYARTPKEGAQNFPVIT
jgi:hypothetical protein